MNYSDIVKDFIKRTQLLLEEYHSYSNRKYEVTLTLNCLFGLLIMPKAAYYKKLRGEKIVFASSDIELYHNTKKVSECNAQIFFHALRNGISHWLENGNENISFDASKNEITKITIEGRGRVQGGDEHIKMIINVQDKGLEEFINVILALLESVN